MRYIIIPVTPFEQNCSLIYCEKTSAAAIIDPGGDIPLIEIAINETGVSLQKILVTHAHLDHVGAVANLAEKYQIPILGPHRDDQFWIDALPQQAEMFDFPPAKKFTPDHWLKQGEQIQVGETTLNVLHCPGHTPGHIIYYSPTDKLAIVGDVLFAGSIGRTDFPQGNHENLIHSIQERLFPLGDEVNFIPGHGPMSSFGQERQNNPFLRA
jgi:glyoxylase-like metal-dependent hydrolase (beta-lactamase superfamily II)